MGDNIITLNAPFKDIDAKNEFLESGSTNYPSCTIS